MSDPEKAALHGQSVTFFQEGPFDERGPLGKSKTELAQEVARRTAQRFSTQALRAALFPEHLGSIDQADGAAHTRGECGDLMTFYLHIRQGRIQRITFTTDGCDATIASGEMLASLVSDLPLDEAAQVTPQDLLAALDGLPPNHVHCATLAVQTLRGAIADYRSRRES